MQREASIPRQDWQDFNLRFRFGVGTSLHQPASWVEEDNWRENACYSLTTHEADVIAEATKDLHDLCLHTLDKVITAGNYGRELGIPDVAIPMIERSWKRRDPSLFGRFDLAYDGVSPPKMIEYNADYACLLLESSVLQYHWAVANQHPRQFNNLHANLIDHWEKAQMKLGFQTLHMTADFSETECVQTLDYMAQTAESAGLTVRKIDLAKIGWDDNKKVFFDDQDQDIQTLFKLKGWEGMMASDFAPYLAIDPETIQVIEPSWKMLLASKAFMATLWKENRNHPNLLPTFHTVDPFGDTFVRKPVWGAMGEGVSIAIDDNRARVEAGLDYESTDIYQQYQPLPVFDGKSALVCSWMVGNNPAGIGIREEKGNIVGGKSVFVPHYLK
ncbi:MAG: glutathionylspermidine synthase [Micavibrio sp.]|nr:glutathionylspermidine synthase [Micavibrio sp.]